MPITLNHSNINIQYSSDKSYIIETVKSDLYRKNENVDTIIRNNVQVAPVTPSIYIENGTNNVYAVESYTYSGSANTADFTRVFTKSTTCDILMIGGGGGGSAGGGGAGGYVYNTGISLNGTYAIKTGKGGAGATGSTNGNQGANSSIIGGAISYTAYGGGGGGGNAVIAPAHTTGQVGSYGGSGHDFAQTQTYTSTQGNRGGRASFAGSAGGGGGGGAGAIGGDSVLVSGLSSQTTQTSYYRGGQGGTGLPNDITGSVLYYAGGGTAGTNTNKDTDTSIQIEVLGGGGIGARAPNENGGNGTNGLGGGGGGGDWERTTGTTGGSGIVIIRYLLGTIPANNLLTNEPVVIQPAFTETIRTFTHSGGTEAQTNHTITIGQNTICDILIVGGGGGGGDPHGGGGGAGQLVLIRQATLNGTYTIKVGKGGIGGVYKSTIPTKGSDSEFGNVIAEGGGTNGGTNVANKNGGSGAGGDGYLPDGGTAGAGNKNTTIDIFPGANVYSRGNNGGIEEAPAGGTGGGGGGAGEQGRPHSFSIPRKGGDGLSGITEINYDFKTNFGNFGKLESDGNYWFAGGGGGGLGIAVTNEGQATGGKGGGGKGGYNNISPNNTGGNGEQHTGSGGGGAGGGENGYGGKGGSGIVIIKFRTIVGAAIPEGNPITHKTLNFTYTPNYPFIQADNTNLKAWYKFDDDFNDSSVNGANLVTNTGTPTLSTTQFKIGKTAFLVNATLRTTGFTFHNKAFAIACWVYQTETGVIIGQLKAQSQNQSLITGLNPNGDYFFAFFQNDMFSPAVYSGDINNWVHLVFQIDTNRNREIWRNGVRIANDTSASFLNTDNNEVILGRFANQGDAFGGYIDDMRFYDKALTSAEISQLYNITANTNLNLYTLNFPVPTIADINNNSNIVLRGAYDIALSTTNSAIIPKTGQYIPKPTTFTNYAVERMYPPVRNFTADTTTVSGQTYGNGIYVVSYSSTFGSSYDPFKCFNTSDVIGGAWAASRYTDGIFNSTSFIVAGYLGDWLKIQLPVAIKLTRFSFLQRIVATVCSPKDFKIYGSNDNITWVELVNKTDTIYNASNMYEQTTPEIKNTYSYYGLVVNKIFSTGTNLNFDEWYIYGQEQLNPQLSIRYHLLNPTLDPIGAQWTYSSNNTNVYHMGSVGIGTTSPEYHFDVRGAIYSSTGGYTSSTLTKWSVLSDRRIKENIVKASYDKCLENVKNIELYNFNFKDNCVNTNDRHQLGFIAQEVQQVYPKAVEVSNMIINLEQKIDDLLTLNITQIDYTLYGAVKSLIEKIENIKIKMEHIKTTYDIP
jgi:hypothetical protein